MPRLAALSAIALLSACSPTRSRVPELQEPVPAANASTDRLVCAQTLSSIPTTSDTFFLHLSLAHENANEHARIFRLTALQEILPHLRVPASLTAPFALEIDSTGLRGSGGSQGSAAGQANRIPRRRKTRGELDGLVSFDLARDGSVEFIGSRFPSTITAIDEVVMRALRTADSAGATLHVPDNLNAPQRFDLRLVLTTEPDSSLIQVGSFEIRFLAYTTLPKRTRGPIPSYPEWARTKGVEAQFLVAALIDTTGKVRRGTFRLLSRAHPDFVREVTSALQQWSFSPAEYRGCPVPFLGIIPFAFSIDRD